MSPAQIHGQLKSRNFTHILFSEKGLERLARLSLMYRLTDPQIENLRQLLDRFQTVFRDRRYTVFKIDPDLGFRTGP